MTHRFYEDVEHETEPFVKHDAGKLGLDLLPHGALIEVAKALDFGADEYKPHNWRRIDRRSRYYAAALRHLFAWWRGEDFDRKSGLSHLAHAACCVLFLEECRVDNLGKDDRL